MAVDWPAFADLVNSNQSFVLTSHIRPDCDALGSELGMAGVLEALGKDVIIVNGQRTPENLAFIDPTDRIKVLNEDITIAELSNRDVFMVLDTSAWAQLGPMGDALREFTGRKIVLDHHQNEDDLGTEFFKDTSAEAAGKLVFQFAEHLGVELTESIARPLFAALSTDTGWFRFPSASSSTYNCAAALVAAGASPSEIYAELYERNTLGRVKLRGEVLSKIQVSHEGRVAFTHILISDFEKTGAMPSDTEDLVNLCFTISGTEVAVIMVEQSSGVYKLSFRSRCELDCSEIAGHFGGGGHKAAAGAGIDGSFDEAKSMVLDAVYQRLHN